MLGSIRKSWVAAQLVGIALAILANPVLAAGDIEGTWVVQRDLGRDPLSQFFNAITGMPAQTVWLITQVGTQYEIEIPQFDLRMAVMDCLHLVVREQC